VTRVAVGRRREPTPGIGFAVARRLLADGLHVLVHSWSAHDAEQPWGAEPVEDVLAELGGVGERLAHVEADLGEPVRPRP
jgi:3-oxoacyl-[acyl-carrier protein] reductase